MDQHLHQAAGHRHAHQDDQRYAQLVSAGPGNEAERLALLEAHRAEVTAKLAELQENLKLIDHKIDVYQGRLAAGDADQLWAPKPSAGTR